MRHASTALHEQHGYHSAVEIDEEIGSWKDWAGPALAVAFFLLALMALILVGTGLL